MGSYTLRVPVASQTPANQQSASMVGVSTPCGAVSTREPPFPFPVCWSCRCVEVFLIICTLSSPCRDEQQVGVPHRAGRYRPGGPPFSSPLCWSCRRMERFMIRGWDIILPGWPRIYEPQVGVSTPCRVVSTWGITVSVPGFCLLYTSPSPRDGLLSRMPSSA